MTQLHALAQAVDHPAPARGKLPRWRLIASLALAPASFSAQIIGSYVIASALCQDGAQPRALLLVVNALATVFAVIGFTFALSSWRATHGEKPGDAREAIDIGEGRTRFLTLCGMWGSSIFLLAVLLDLTAIVEFGTCPGAQANRWIDTQPVSGFAGSALSAEEGPLFERFAFHEVEQNCGRLHS